MTGLFGTDGGLGGITEPGLMEVGGFVVFDIGGVADEGGDAVGMNILDSYIPNRFIFVAVDFDEGNGAATLHITHRNARDDGKGVLFRGHETTPIAPHVGIDGKDTLEGSSFTFFDQNTIDVGELATVGSDTEQVAHFAGSLAVVHVDIVHTM